MQFHRGSGELRWTPNGSEGVRYIPQGSDWIPMGSDGIPMGSDGIPMGSAVFRRDSIGSEDSAVFHSIQCDSDESRIGMLVLPPPSWIG